MSKIVYELSCHLKELTIGDDGITLPTVLGMDLGWGILIEPERFDETRDRVFMAANLAFKRGLESYKKEELCQKQ